MTTPVVRAGKTAVAQRLRAARSMRDSATGLSVDEPDTSTADQLRPSVGKINGIRVN